MATLAYLPATTYRPSAVQAPHRRRSLNVIMEDSEEESKHEPPDVELRQNGIASNDWLSPLSDHFPTPRANHFQQHVYRPASPADSDDSSKDSAAPSSAPWDRDSFMTEATDFDDLYDVSDDDSRRKTRSSVTRKNSVRSTRSSRPVTTSNRSSTSSLPTLVIPNNADPWAEVTAFKLSLSSPVPPTPPAKLPMSPEVFQFLRSQQETSVPSSSTPPSLDGSLDSEQLALHSAPSTPNIDYDSEDDSARPNWGVQLQPLAMATLEAISGPGSEYPYQQDTEQVIEVSSIESAQPREMQQSLPPIFTNLHRHNSVILTPSSQESMDSLTRLDIPSPGGFFASMSRNARHTWHLVPITPDNDAPPSSTTAENFYNTPWSPPIERVLEVPEPTGLDGPPTARLVGPGIREGSPTDDLVVDEILATYTSNLDEPPATQLDRTCMWLTAQHNFLSELINPTEARDDEVALLKRASSLKISLEAIEEAAPKRKVVRFSEAPDRTDQSCPIPERSSSLSQESTYFRAFQQFLARSRSQDTFVHRIPRFEALQNQRVAFPAAHRAHLLGKHQLSVVPLSPKRRMSSNVARGDDGDLFVEDRAKIQADKEAEALAQMAAATWNVMAAKLLNGGRLIASPVTKRLARVNKKDGFRDRARILDLGGQAACDWAWHVAAEYPACKVYTLTTTALKQLSNSAIRGPRNLRPVTVAKLTVLPFKDNQFDVISAREIYSILRERGENGEDEWSACLQECFRILKPGGYLEFMVMDSDVVNAGSLGRAKSVEFGFNLRTLGYDAHPTKKWLGRLRKEGFVGIKRAWVFLPMGEKRTEEKGEREDSNGGKEVKLEAIVQGSTSDVACVTGLVGGWNWEKWLLKCRVQTVGDEGVLEGVQSVVEEGRACGAGWRTVNGWARKPLA